MSAFVRGSMIMPAIIRRMPVAYNRRKLLEELDRLIADNPRMRLSEIARSLDVDRHTIENAMRSRRKMTFREYRRRRLLQLAREMLDRPHMSVKEVGIKLGYPSAASFSRFVRKAAGQSPSQLRGWQRGRLRKLQAGVSSRNCRSRRIGSKANWDASGFIDRFTDLMPSVNNYEVGDGLNVAGNKWVRRTSGGDNVLGLGEDNQRKQINVKIDHNFSTKHRLSANYSHEKDTAEDNFKTWSNAYGGAVLRKPQLVNVSFTSTLRSNLLNEFRFGMSRSESFTYSALANPDTGSEMKALMETLWPAMGLVRRTIS
jgi:AraC-like DNA-binding protein